MPVVMSASLFPYSPLIGYNCLIKFVYANLTVAYHPIRESYWRYRIVRSTDKQIDHVRTQGASWHLDRVYSSCLTLRVYKWNQMHPFGFICTFSELQTHESPPVVWTDERERERERESQLHRLWLFSMNSIYCPPLEHCWLCQWSLAGCWWAARSMGRGEHRPAPRKQAKAAVVTATDGCWVSEWHALIEI